MMLGPIGRLGKWSATHGRVVAATWAVLIVGLGVLAPRVETALSGAGWQDSGSESVQARAIIQKAFDGNASSALTVVVSSKTLSTSDAAFASTILRVE
jgi:putative drug exporter of the RND superfamily